MIIKSISPVADLIKDQMVAALATQPTTCSTFANTPRQHICGFLCLLTTGFYRPLRSCPLPL